MVLFAIIRSRCGWDLRWRSDSAPPSGGDRQEERPRQYGRRARLEFTTFRQAEAGADRRYAPLRSQHNNGVKSRIVEDAHADADGRRAALVCRTQAGGCRRGQSWRGHAHLGATRAQRQPAGPRLCRQGRQAWRFRRHWPAQQQRLFRNDLCGMEVRCDTDVADLAAAARRGRRGAGYPQAFTGGRRPARLECAQFAARQFRAGRLFGRTLEQPGGALLESHDQRRLDRTAEGNPRSSAGGDGYR